MKIQVKDKSSAPYDVYVDVFPPCTHDSIIVDTYDGGYDGDGNYSAHEQAVCADCGATAIYERDEFEDTY